MSEMQFGVDADGYPVTAPYGLRPANPALDAGLELIPCSEGTG